MSRIALFIFLLFSALQLAALQYPSDAMPDYPDLHTLQQWLNEKDHQEIPWKVQARKPVLTFQQRDVVRVVATIDSARLQAKSARRNLVFVIMVADASGKWLDEFNVVKQQFNEALGPDTDVELSSEVALRPGTYTIGAILFDSVTNEHNVSMVPVTVDPIKGDPFPALLNDLPAVQFVRGQVYGEDTFLPGLPLLPVKNKRPVKLDLIVDLSTREHQVTPVELAHIFGMGSRRSRPPKYKPLNANSYTIGLIQSASVLGALNMTTGCLSITAFDAYKQETILGPVSASAVDWQAILKRKTGPDKDTISVGALKARTDSPKFFAQNFYAALRSSECGTGSDVLHVVVVLSHGFEFPDHSQKVKMENCACTVFYMRQADTAMDSDDLKGMLSPLSPRTLVFHDAEQFRGKLADLIHAIESVSQ